MLEIIYENKDWLPFFEEALKEVKIPYRLAFIDTLTFDPDSIPDDIIYLNRISPSSHTRGHLNTFERGQKYLEHLAAHGRTVLNGIRSFHYEISKQAQFRLFDQLGIKYPKTIFSKDLKELCERSKELRFPLLTKHNCSGKGLGIELFQDQKSLRDYLFSNLFIPSPDGLLLLQEYIAPKGDRITRVEISNGKLVYAFHSSTAQGFELCPADACQLKRAPLAQAVCETGPSLFEYIPDFKHPLAAQYIQLCAAAGYDLAGIEFLEDQDGTAYTYDVNGTTNYSSVVEKASGWKAKRAFQELLVKHTKSFT